MLLFKNGPWSNQYPALECMVALLARIGLAATFWLSGQTKVAGLNIDILGETPWQWGIPHVTDSTIALFVNVYKLPLLSPEVAAIMAATAEHIFPLLLFIGLATRFAALALMLMTLVIQIFVYPDAWPVHAIWMASQLYLVVHGGGSLALDRLLSRYTKW